MHALLPLLLLLQQPLPQYPTTPPSGDTVGYWQQRADYRIVATLDERAQVLHATAELTYVNHSPDTLREMYVQQLLNAFRPGSRWSAADAREGRVRFQTLREPDYAYERFTATPVVDGAAEPVDYPFAPDSTIAHLTLPRPLAPGDSVVVRFAWDARPSATVYRRQGRRGRHWDFSQWYPKVSVYDRQGWEVNPFIPNGEMYGEFGSFDVTLVVPKDQVIGATGVPVEGDPGWEHALRWGAVHYARDAYGAPPPAPPVNVPPGDKRVRFLARDVHHFGWAVDPAYIYEGGLLRDAVPIHALYLPGGEAKLGNGKLVTWNMHALEWLERIYGAYGYPQLTALIRLDPGATEFPMMAMYGNPGEGTVLHEVGHIYSYGMLANNEWRAGWMDEGLTQYQSTWYARLTPQDFAEGAPKPPRPAVRGYRAHAVRPAPAEASQMALYRVDLLGRAEPPESPAHSFNEFNIYQESVYLRPYMMYGQLRTILGDSGMVAFLHEYYARWKFKHVDELAMRRSAERVWGQDLDWFFAQWVHRTGLIDYALRDVDIHRDSSGWLTRARVVRRGEYRQPIPVGARTSRGWTMVKSAALDDDQWVELRTAERPRNVRLDPRREIEDWDRRNDVDAPVELFDRRASRVVFDWPFLDQEARNRNLVELSPLAWYTDPGGVTLAARMRTNYQGWLDRRDVGIALSTRAPDGSGASRVQGWLAVENPRLPGSARPLVGVRAGVWALDGTALLDVRKMWDESRFLYADGPQSSVTVGLTASLPYSSAWVDDARWENATVADVSAEYQWRRRRTSGVAGRAAVYGGVVDDRGAGGETRMFERIEGEARVSAPLARGSRIVPAIRVFAGASEDAPPQRAIGLSALDVTETFSNHLLRGRGAPLARGGVHYVAIGGAGLRGYSPLVRMRRVVAANAQLAAAVNRPRAGSLVPRLELAAFADGAWGRPEGEAADSRAFVDAGFGVIAHESLYDRPVVLRVDFPIYVRQPELGVGDDAGAERLAFRWTVSLGDLW